MSGGRRSASVVATSPLTLVTIFNREIWRLEREAPEVAAAFRETISARVGGSADGAPLELEYGELPEIDAQAMGVGGVRAAHPCRGDPLERGCP